MGLQEWFESGTWLVVLLTSMLTATGAGIVTYIIAAGKKSKEKREEETLKKVDQHLSPTFDQLTSTLLDIKNELAESKKRDERSDRAMLQMMRTNLHTLNGECKKKGYTTDIDRSRFVDTFKSYTELGGNHEMELVYEAFMALDSEEVYKKKNPQAGE